MNDLQRPDGGRGDHQQNEPSASRVPEIVAMLGGPVFVDMRPGHVRVVCQGFTGVGHDRMSAFRALAERARAVPSS